MTGKSHLALSAILRTVGIDSAKAGDIEMSGSDPVLPTSFLLGTAGAAAIGAVGIAANELWKLRGGQPQNMAIDSRKGAMAMRSNVYLKLDGENAGRLWGDISGFYETADNRWVQLHCNYPHHRDGVLRVLKCENDKDHVKAAVAKWQGLELDQHLADEGLCGALVRNTEEWQGVAQSSAVAKLPLMEIIKIGDSPAEPLPEAPQPLSGIRALDLTRVLAGPVAGRTLAEHGADVMRVSSRHLPFIESLLLDTGHGKLASHIDLTKDSGKATLTHLIRDADVFSQAYRPGSIAGRGFGPEDVARLRPGIIYLTLSAYGHEGPWAMRRGYDSLVQSASGIVDEHSGAGSPSHLPGQVLDYASGYLGAFGVMAALARRARDGGSYMVRLSLAQTAHWLRSLGRVEGDDDPRQLPDPDMASISDLTIETDTPWGKLTHLAPHLEMSETPPHWRRPTVPLGTHDPVWPT